MPEPPPPFLVIGLPRSRTAWLSRFLTYRQWTCGHEELRHARSLDDVRAWASQPFVGTCETTAAPFWRLFETLAPGMRIVTIRRDIPAVIDSLMALAPDCGFAFDRATLETTLAALSRKLDQVEARTRCLSVAFDDLATPQACARVFETCLQQPFDAAHWARWAAINVQCDMRALMKHFAAYRPALAKLASIAKHRTLTRMALRAPVSSDGITLQIEDFDSWVRDGAALFRAHCVEVGEAPGQWLDKNIPLMRLLFEAGALQVMTARANGRMFGYLVSLIAPSLESANIVSSQNTLFYAEPGIAGLGLRLQRAAAAALAARGVDEVHLRAGVRGDGARTAALYRRMGAEFNGEVFRLKLAPELGKAA